jgi:hypothetical protein
LEDLSAFLGEQEKNRKSMKILPQAPKRVVELTCLIFGITAKFIFL